MMNNESSRAHLLLTLDIEQRSPESGPENAILALICISTIAKKLNIIFDETYNQVSFLSSLP